MPENNQTNRATAYPFDRTKQVDTKKPTVKTSESLTSMLGSQFVNNKETVDYSRFQSKAGENKQYRDAQQKKYEAEQKRKLQQQMSAKEIKEKAIQARELKAFLQQDENMLLDKFLVIRDIPTFMCTIQTKTNASDITGVYIICNVTKRKCFVGKHNMAFDACWQIFRDKSESKNYIPQVKDDFDSGDQMAVNFVRLKDTNYDTLDDLSAFYIDKYKALQDGYNTKASSKPKRHWYACK